jgi:hypothetical protein
MTAMCPKFPDDDTLAVWTLLILAGITHILGG